MKPNVLHTSIHASGAAGAAQQVEWISTEEAARLLDKSKRTVLAMAASGAIKSKRERDPSKRGQKVTLLHAGQVAAFAEGGSPDAQKAAGVQLARKSASGPLAGLQAQWGLAAPVPWLTLADAADVCGLPATVLTQLIMAGKLPALNVGVRLGGKWRVSRRDLDAIAGEYVV